MDQVGDPDVDQVEGPDVNLVGGPVDNPFGGPVDNPFAGPLRGPVGDPTGGDPFEDAFDEVKGINPLLQMHKGRLNVGPLLPIFEHFTFRPKEVKKNEVGEITEVVWIANYPRRANYVAFRSLDDMPKQAWQRSLVVEMPVRFTMIVEISNLRTGESKDYTMKVFPEGTTMGELGKWLQGFAKVLGAETVDEREWWLQGGPRAKHDLYDVFFDPTFDPMF